jgi:hypothetical protein
VCAKKHYQLLSENVYLYVKLSWINILKLKVFRTRTVYRRHHPYGLQKCPALALDTADVPDLRLDTDHHIHMSYWSVLHSDSIQTIQSKWIAKVFQHIDWIWTIPSICITKLSCTQTDTDHLSIRITNVFKYPSRIQTILSIRFTKVF